MNGMGGVMNGIDKVMNGVGRRLRQIVAVMGAGVIIAGLMAGSASAGVGLDPSYGQGGKVLTSFGNNVRPVDGAIDASGRLVVVGSIDDFQIATQTFFVARYLPNGALDTLFGSNGSVRIAFTSFINSANSVAIQPDGKIVLAGGAESADGTLSEFAVARLLPNGGLDPTFGTGGKVMTDFFGPPPHPGGFRETANVVIVQPNGKILVGGLASSNPHLPQSTALARYNSNGTLDPTFGTAGLVGVRAIGNVNALALLSDGRILALNGGDRPAEFEANGALDNGVTPGTIVARAHAGISVFQPDGSQVVIGSEVDDTRFDVDTRVRRFNPTGGSDPTFISGLFDFGPEDTNLSNVPQALALTSTGQIVIGGFADSTATCSLFGLALLNPDGTFDTGFGNNGALRTNFACTDQVMALAVQSDDRFIAIGAASAGGGAVYNLALARYLNPQNPAAAPPSAETISVSDNTFELLDNPASMGRAAIRLHLATAGPVQASIYDSGGRLIHVLADEAFTAGEHTLAWDGRDAHGTQVPAGVYFTRVRFGSGSQALRADKKLVLLK